MPPSESFVSGRGFQCLAEDSPAVPAAADHGPVGFLAGATAQAAAGDAPDPGAHWSGGKVAYTATRTIASAITARRTCCTRREKDPTKGHYTVIPVRGRAIAIVVASGAAATRPFGCPPTRPAAGRSATNRDTSSAIGRTLNRPRRNLSRVDASGLRKSSAFVLTPRPATYSSRPGQEGRWNCRGTRRCGSATARSAPGISCLV